MCNKEVGDDPKFLAIQNLTQLLDAVVRNGIRPSIPPTSPPDLVILLRNCWDGGKRKKNKQFFSN